MNMPPPSETRCEQVYESISRIHDMNNLIDLIIRYSIKPILDRIIGSQVCFLKGPIHFCESCGGKRHLEHS